MLRESESIIEELEDIFCSREYTLNLLSELKDSIQSELDKAVKDERAGCALACEEMLDTLEYGQGRFAISYCAEAIRKRGEDV